MIAAAAPALAAATGAAPDAVLLGARTWGGIASAANIGLARADGEVVVFVDGEGWLAPEDFRICRSRFEASGEDLLFAGFMEFDSAAGTFRPPADRDRWALAGTGPDEAGRRLLALSLDAAPWRRLHRRSLIEAHGLRFPEGPLPHEEHPFHWALCLKARRIGFADRIVCFRRDAPAAGAAGADAAAFLAHYRTIAAMLPPQDAALAAAAMEWLVAQMARHLPVLPAGATWAYVRQAAAVLRGFDPAVWRALAAPRFAGTPVGSAVEQLMSLPPETVAGLWLAERQAAGTARLREDLAAIAGRLDGIAAAHDRAAAAAAGTREGVEVLLAAAELRALAGLARPGGG